MERELLNLSIQNLVQQLKPFYQDSDLYSQFTSFTKKNLSKEPRSNKFDFIVNYAYYCVTKKEKNSTSLHANHLSSIFNILFKNGTHKYDVPPQPDVIPYPTEKLEISPEQQYELLKTLLNDLSNISTDENHLDQILDACQNSLSDLSDGVDPTESYLSLADKLRFSTALIACFYQYLTADSRNIPESEFKDKFYQKKSLLLFSCDISGIQKFIYTVSGKGVLKSLRSRSFYIDILLEHVINSVLQKLGLSSSNIIYSGGGRAYLLLSNTGQTKQTIQSSMLNINSWLLENFDISLYIAYGYTECSAEELFLSADISSYNAIFIRLSSELSANKADRYQPEQIIWLNSQSDHQHERECRICSRSDREIDSDNVCTSCRDFISISPFLLNESLGLVMLNQKLETDLPYLKFPAIFHGTNYLYFLDQKQISALSHDSIIQIYHRGEHGPGRRFETETYAYTIQGEMATFEQLAEGSEGIQRIAVLRADVDNLGQAFMRGFGCASGYRPLLLTAALSRRLSLFFKRYMKKIADGALKEKRFTLTPHPSQEKKKLVVVYSGGDDLFLAGAWNDVIDTAVDLRSSFDKYTAGSLSLSAGIGIFEIKYPLSAMAEETEKLVDAAKSIDESKDAIALFGSEIQKDATGTYHSVAVHCYHWKDFTQKVIGEKLRLLQDYFSRSRQMERGNGNAFLYRLQAYIETTQRNPNERINIARFAYLLARLAPTEKDSNLQAFYSQFSLKMYRWILNAEDRQQLLTAIALYIYLKRSADYE